MYKTFESWLDEVLSAHSPKGIIAYNFNLYESEFEGEYDVQLIGADRYSELSDDWACQPIYSSGENLFSFTAGDWEKGLLICIELIKQYLEQGKFACILKQSNAVTAGFVDGDLEVVYK